MPCSIALFFHIFKLVLLPIFLSGSLVFLLPFYIAKTHTSLRIFMSSSSVNRFAQPCIHGHFVSSYEERKSRFMRWLSKIFKGGSSRGLIGGQRPQFLGDENMVLRAPIRSMDDRSKAENEELDHAVSLSLDGGHRRRTDNDEALARALHESLNMPSNLPYAPPVHYPRGYRLCGGCKHEIGRGNYLGCMGAFWHPECFCCHACGNPITEHEFSLSGTNPYHKSCYRDLHHPKCDVCHQFVRPY